MIIGDFNCTPDTTISKDFLENNDLSNVMHKNTCWKSKTGACIDLILTNRKFNLMQTDALETKLNELSGKLCSNLNLSYLDFYTIFTSVLDKHAPLKSKLVRANNRPHVTKSLRKAIMHTSKLKNIANKSGNSADWRKTKKLGCQIKSSSKSIPF